MNIIPLIFVGIALSMDAFSLSICINSTHYDEKIMMRLASLIGLMHIIMTTCGLLIGHFIELNVPLFIQKISFIIYLVIGIFIILGSIKKKKESFLITNYGLFMLAFGLSTDSFTVGLGNVSHNNVIYMPILFGMISYIFSILGLKTGKYLNKKTGKYFIFLGGSIFIIYAFFKIPL